MTWKWSVKKVSSLYNRMLIIHIHETFIKKLKLHLRDWFVNRWPNCNQPDQVIFYHLQNWAKRIVNQALISMFRIWDYFLLMWLWKCSTFKVYNHVSATYSSLSPFFRVTWSEKQSLAVILLSPSKRRATNCQSVSVPKLSINVT